MLFASTPNWTNGRHAHGERRSLLDKNCKMHDLDNLWVVDSSSLPSSAALNPALTIAANALRVAAGFNDAVKTGRTERVQ